MRDLQLSFATRPASGERGQLRLVALIAVALAFSGNGIWMLADPAGWFAAVPGVADTGPFNPHFVRDIGCAYVVLAVTIGMSAALPTAALPLLILASLSVGLHAALHIAEMIAGHLAWQHLSIDFGGVFLPAIVLPLLALWSHRSTGAP